jgi:hypothetical protein
MMSDESINFEKRVSQYIKLRDTIKELEDKHKALVKPYKDVLEKLNIVLLQHLNTIGSDSTSIDGVGTVYKTTKRSASLADADAFMQYVIAQQEWDLLDRKANVIAIEDYMKEHAGELPPGVNYNRHLVVGVRRKNGD